MSSYGVEGWNLFLWLISRLSSGIPSKIYERLCPLSSNSVELCKSLCLVKQHHMNACGGVEVQLHDFLNSAHNGQECSASRLCYFTLRERDPQYPLQERAARPLAQSECCGIQLISCLCPEPNPDFSVLHFVD